MDSDEYTSEDSKKRSRKEDVGDIFNKSKKINRTPTKQQKDESKMDQLLKMMQTLTDQTKCLTTEVKEIKEEQREYRNEIRDLKKELDDIRQSNEELKKENSEMKQELKRVKIRVEQYEKEKKTKNVIVQGLPMDTNNPNELKATMTNFIETELGIEVKIDEVYKLSNKTCLVKTNNINEKEKIMQNKSKLRTIKPKIYINNDLTQEEMKVQQEIQKIAKAEKSKGKNTRIGYQKLIIDGTIWKWNKEKHELEKIKQDTSKNQQKKK